jgi:glycosyltransferase involved in cell wall biosynthesis
MAEQHTAASGRRIRVCLVVPKLEIGGGEVEVICLIKHLDRSRFEVSLLCLASGDAEMEMETRQYLKRFTTAGFRWRYFPFSLARMIAWLRRGRYDVVHCHMPMADVIGRFAGWLAGVPVLITTEHGKHVGKPWYHLLMERLLNPLTDMRICVSQDILEIRARRERTPRSKLMRIPNGIETAKYNSPARERTSVMAKFGWEARDPLVISVGRLAPEKNYCALVEAIARAAGRFPEVRCLLVGSGPCRDEILTQIESLGLTGRVMLTGSRSDVPDLLGAADVFVLASLKEGLPVSLLEAMAAGKAVVVTSVGGMPEVIADGDNGLVVPSRDTEALAQAIEKLLRDCNLRKEFGRAVRDKAEREFDIRRVADEIGRVYTDLCGRKRKRATLGRD